MNDSLTTDSLTILNGDGEQSLPAFIEQVFERYGDFPAFSCLNHRLSYRELDTLSADFAGYLQSLGLCQGDRIALQLPNLLQYPVAAFGAWRAGLVIVNVNPQYTANELLHQLNDSGAKALVVFDQIAEAAAEVLSRTEITHVVLTSVADLHSWPARTAINAACKYIKKTVADIDISGAVTFRNALKIGRSAGFTVPADVGGKNSGANTALLQYTGGTTGVSKGAMLSHGNLLANVRQLREHLSGSVTEASGQWQEVYVAPLPLYHVYAFQFHMLSLFSAGALSVLIPDPRDIDAFVKTLSRNRFSGFLGINTLFNGLCEHPQFQQLDFSALKSTSSGGMALTTDVAARWKAVTGGEICEGYGMTEASPVVCANRPDANCVETVGQALPDTELKVIDAEGNTLETGERGELCVRGPQVMLGYWRRAEATAEVLSEDGWLQTGDVAVIQADGFVKIVDRIKDMIIVSGFNVYPNEIDDVLCTHPQILESAVVGVDDAKSGEAVMAYVVLREGVDMQPSELKEYCRGLLTGYKVPRHIEFVDSLPKSNVGKVLRRELRTEAAA